MSMPSIWPFILFVAASATTMADVIVEPISPRNQSGVVPALKQNTESETCRLDLSEELFGGVSEACGRNPDRSRCCPVLAAWLFAAHARYALQLPQSNATDSDIAPLDSLPVPPDDSQKCVNMLQTAMDTKKLKLPQPNATCDTILCFCGIRLHQITSLSCPAAFNVTANSRSAKPTSAVRNLERSCRNSTFPGCTRCLGALQKLKTPWEDSDEMDARGRKMFNRDCQLMGLTWLLSRNKTAYIPTVSAVLRAIMYASHSHSDSQCSPDQDNMPLAVNSNLEFVRVQSSSVSASSPIGFFYLLLLLF